jgi:hypothetical protein
MKKIILVFTAFFTTVFGSAAFAAATDYTTLLASADFSTTVVAILDIASKLALVYVTYKGVKLVLTAIKGA